MKAYLISDNVDTLVGMSIVGIKGEVIHDKDKVISKLNELRKDPEIFMILVTEKTSELVPEEIMQIKLSKKGALIVEIPDRHGSRKTDDWLMSYVKEAVGLKL